MTNTIDIESDFTHSIDSGIMKDIILGIIRKEEYLHNIFRFKKEEYIPIIERLSCLYRSDDDYIKLVNDGVISSIIDINGIKYTHGMGGYISTTFQFKFGGESKSDTIRVFYKDYLTLLRDKKLKSMNLNIVDIISNRLTEYLEFDSKELFIDPLIRVFGGAIRDSINGEKIHDIDIICGTKSVNKVEQILESKGYSFIECLVPKDLASVYTDIQIINEPHSWVKNGKVVQIIKPATRKVMISEDYIKTYHDLISNVDISCCGVSFDGYNLYENFIDAVYHCREKIFWINTNAKMYSPKRIHHRVHKLTERGWAEIDRSSKSADRDLKLDIILDDNNIDFIREYSKPPTELHKDFNESDYDIFNI